MPPPRRAEAGSDVQRPEPTGCRVVVSNGFSRFQLAVAAAENAKRGLLRALVTGAYPTSRVSAVLRVIPHAKTQRLLDRGEDLDDRLVHALPGSEALHSASRWLDGTPAEPAQPRLDATAFAIYGSRAASVLRRVARPGDIYHFRSGFGGRSLRTARAIRMPLICDHSIAHPWLVERLTENRGRLPGDSRPTSSPMWRRVMHDLLEADHVLVNSDFVRDTFVHEGLDPEKVSVIYWGVDESFIRSLPQRAREPRALKVAFVGSFEMRKGAEVMVEAHALLRPGHRAITLAGPVPGESRRRFPGFLSSPDVEVVGNLARPDFATFLTSVDVVVFPSLAEGSARVVFESLAAGCAVITTPNAGSIVQDGVHGTLVPPGDSEALATAIERAHSTPDEVRAIGRRNAGLIRQEHTQRNYGDDLAEFYARFR